MKSHHILACIVLALAIAMTARAGIPLDFGAGVFTVLGVVWLILWYLRRKKKVAPKPPAEG